MSSKDDLQKVYIPARLVYQFDFNKTIMYIFADETCHTDVQLKLKGVECLIKVPQIL